jgi:hypothetical protein
MEAVMRIRERISFVFLIIAMVLLATGLEVPGQQRVRPPRKAVGTDQNMAATAIQNNCTATAMPDIALVKLSVVSGPSITKAAPGQTFEISAVLENRGQCETGPFKVQISVYTEDVNNDVKPIITDKVILKKLVQSIQPTRDKNPVYTNVTVSYTLSPNYRTTYMFYATADPDNNVTEFIENNNAIERGEGININIGSPKK